MQKEFETLYKKLNPAQKEAVDSIEGPVMVVAGPGTGKTQILTLRIANILRRTDTEPDNILALTFTESASYSMRKRLAEIIGSPAYRVAIFTFHSFCNDVIRRYPEEFSRIIGSTNITEVEQIQILEQSISSLPLTLLRPFGDTFHYLRPILGAINELKREDIDVEEFEDRIAKQEKDLRSRTDVYYETGPHKGKMRAGFREIKKEIQKNTELARVYRAYEEELRRQKLYDYTDMIVEVIKALKSNQDLLLALEEQYQYILADEHQDANSAQNKLLELLSSFHENPNLFIVGDERQAIFRFQGASLDNFHYFKKRHSTAKLIHLEVSYRSTQTILDSARSLIEKNIAKTSGSNPNLKAHFKEAGEKIALFEFSKPDVEYYFLAKDISARIAGGVSPSQIAVLFRDNKDAFPIAAVLEKTDIPFVIESEQNVLKDPDIQKLLLIFRTVEQFGSDELFLKALHIDFLNTEPLDIYKLVTRSQAKRMSVLDIARSSGELERLELKTADAIHAFYRSVASWTKDAKNKSFIEFFESVVRDSGFLHSLLSRNAAIEKMDKLNGLFDEIKATVENHKNYGLEEFIEYLDMWEQHGILIKQHASGQFATSVRLMTAHKSKGLEFEYVYVVNAFDGHWGNRRRGKRFLLPQRMSWLSDPLEEIKNNDDERRLFYVVLTRAKKGVLVTHSRESVNKTQQLPSQFISEINPQFLEKKDVQSIEDEFLENREALFASKVPRGPDMKDREFLRELFLYRGFSVTALNNYATCPWRYFYNNLLRIPKAPTKQQMYGTAAHAALKDFFDKYREGEELKKAFLLTVFAAHLNQQPLQEKDFKEAEARGRKALGGYYDAYRSTWERNSINELNVGAILLTPEIKLTGKLDKVEILSLKNDVNVVDYKTTKPKSRNVIEGKTRNATGDFKRQLVFYNILLNHYGNGKYTMVSGEIDFIEPNDRGIYKKEQFTISKDGPLRVRWPGNHTQS